MPSNAKSPIAKIVGAAKELFASRDKRRVVVWGIYALTSIAVAYAYTTLTLERLEQEGEVASEVARRITIDVPSGKLIGAPDEIIATEGEIEPDSTEPTPDAPEILDEDSATEDALPTEALVEGETDTTEEDAFIDDIARSLAEGTTEIEEELVEDESEPEPTLEELIEEGATVAPTTLLADDQPDENIITDDAKNSRPEMPELPLITNPAFSHKISIIVRDVGLRRDQTLLALGLAEGVTYAFSTYAPDLVYLSTKMKESGRPFLLQLPLEDSNSPYSDPGPYGLLRDASLEQNLYRLQKLLEMAGDSKALFAPSEEVFTSSTRAAIPLLDSMQRSGVTLVLQAHEGNEEAIAQAYSVGLAHLAGYTELDKVRSRREIYEAMAAIRNRINKDEGDIVLVAKPYPLSISLLSDLINELITAGIPLTPPTDMAIR